MPEKSSKPRKLAMLYKSGYSDRPRSSSEMWLLIDASGVNFRPSSVCSVVRIYAVRWKKFIPTGWPPTWFLDRLFVEEPASRWSTVNIAMIDRFSMIVRIFMFYYVLPCSSSFHLLRWRHRLLLINGSKRPRCRMFFMSLQISLPWTLHRDLQNDTRVSVHNVFLSFTKPELGDGPYQ